MSRELYPSVEEQNKALIKFIEECAEVIHAASKYIKHKDKRAKDWLEEEIRDMEEAKKLVLDKVFNYKSV